MGKISTPLSRSGLGTTGRGVGKEPSYVGKKYESFLSEDVLIIQKKSRRAAGWYSLTGGKDG